MVRVIVAAVLGAIIIVVWGMLSWTVIGWHDTSGGAATDEAPLVEAMRATLPEDGVYWLPYWPEGEAAEAPGAMDAYHDRHREGPLAMIVYHPEGREPMPPMLFARGALISFGGALIASILLAVAGSLRTYIGRVAFVGMLGLFTAFAADLTYWNWMFMPTDYSLVNAADHVIGWSLAGLVIAALVKPKRPAAA